MSLAPHQERVVTEKSELDEKIAKLYTFVGSPTFKQIVPDLTEQARLNRQLDVMHEYSNILGWRIAAFTKV